MPRGGVPEGRPVPGSFRRADERSHEAERELQRWNLPHWQERVVRRFHAERDRGWYLLLNSLAPETPEHRPDAIVVGPRGVLVVLLRESVRSSETVRRAFRWAGELIANAHVPTGEHVTENVLYSIVVRPADGHSVPSDGEFLLTGEGDLDRVFDRGEPILTPTETHALARHFASQIVDLSAVGWNPRAVPWQRTPEAHPGSAELLDVDAVCQYERASAVHRPLRDWRIFLDSSQLGLVRRAYSGPARITGPPGSGKTVLALHRLAYHARRLAGPVLYTAHTSTSPRIANADFRRMAPQLAHRVEFNHVHGWAKNFLRRTGHNVEVHESAVWDVLNTLWRRPELARPLYAFRPFLTYWKDEIDRVIKGRDIRDLDTYRHAPRKGRGESLPGLHAAVWAFYQEYERELSERGIHDHNDVLLAALRRLEDRPVSPPYAMVVVDEAQDLTLLGLRLAHAISGDGPNQLLLVSDGQQQMYPGGWTLSDAGIALCGRGEVLRWNYRNRHDIAQHAGQLDAHNRFDDLSAGRCESVRSAVPLLPGGYVERWSGSSDQQASVLVNVLRRLGEYLPDGLTPLWGDTAVLTRTKQGADHWVEVLHAAGFPVVRLDQWHGEDTSEHVYVGTIHRAKNAEFRSVLLPAGHSSTTPGGREFPETVENEQRLWLVARTRARDFLWIGSLREQPS